MLRKYLVATPIATPTTEVQAPPTRSPRMRDPRPHRSGPVGTGLTPASTSSGPANTGLTPASTSHSQVGLMPAALTGMPAAGSHGPTALPPLPADLVFTFSYVSWQAAAARGWYMPEDRLARALVSHERIARLLVSDLMRSLPIKLLRDITHRNRSPEPFPSDQATQLMSPLRLRRNYPTSIAAVQRACQAYDRALQRRAHAMGLKEPALITANPLMAGFAKFDWAGPVTFFAHDDWLPSPLPKSRG